MRLKILVVIMAVAIFLAPAVTSRADKIQLSEENPTFYTVVKGDTLWDISGKFFDDPFRWPKLWNWNPYIHNPHLIYPGDVLKITPDGIERVEEIVEEKKVAERDASGLDRIRLRRLRLADRELPPAPRVAIFSSSHLNRKGMITKKAIEKSAAIASSTDENILLMHAGDEVFVSYNKGAKLSPGETYALFIITEKVRHPVTNRNLGHLTEDVGSIVLKGPVRSNASKNNLFVGTIDVSLREINAGTLLKPYMIAPEELEIIPTSTAVEGYIITGIGNKNGFGERDSIFIDKGRGDGIKVGNLLQVYRPRSKIKDPLQKNRSIQLPPEDIGVIIITNVGDDTSQATIISSHKILNRGDRIRGMGPLN